LKPALAGRGDHIASYAGIGNELGLSEGAVKVAVYRMRQRFREILRQQIAQTVGSEDEVEEEILFLFRAFSRSSG
ncbi:MAG: sigma-70 family RNA polymerase sigma factor, partial [Verrucomicrobiota bacterium]